MRRQDAEKYVGVSVETLLDALEDRARRISAPHGHILGVWRTAKHEFGKGSRRSICLMCGRHAYVLPYGNPRSAVKVAQQVPGVSGAALTEGCGEGGSQRRLLAGENDARII